MVKKVTETKEQLERRAKRLEAALIHYAQNVVPERDRAIVRLEGRVRELDLALENTSTVVQRQSVNEVLWRSAREKMGDNLILACTDLRRAISNGEDTAAIVSEILLILATES